MALYQRRLEKNIFPIHPILSSLMQSEGINVKVNENFKLDLKHLSFVLKAFESVLIGIAQRIYSRYKFLKRSVFLFFLFNKRQCACRMFSRLNILNLILI